MRNPIFRKGVMVVVAWVLALSVSARSSRILSDQDRESYLSDLESILQYQDSDLEQAIPYIINPFFFDQPLLLKLRAPGGVSDTDLLASVARVLVDEVSGAFVRGDRRSLLMKSGDLLREGDHITRTLPDLGGIQSSVTIVRIERERFILERNGFRHEVDLSGR
ncbi:MAG: hypothetical protein ABQ298_12955 [Puniceicoccaceae bacterium]